MRNLKLIDSRIEKAKQELVKLYGNRRFTDFVVLKVSENRI